MYTRKQREPSLKPRAEGGLKQEAHGILQKEQVKRADDQLPKFLSAIKRIENKVETAFRIQSRQDKEIENTSKKIRGIKKSI